MTELRQAALAQQDERDWSLLEATQESLREHMAEIHRLRAALAQQAEPVEPVAWMVYTLDGKSVCVTDNPDDFSGGHRALPLYTAPPQRPVEPVQEPVEPVAWRTFDGEGGYEYRAYEDNECYAAAWAQRNPNHVGWVEPLYTAPPQRPAEPVEEPVEPVATLTAQRDALLEACKAYDQWADKTICCDPELAAIRQQMRAAIKAVEEGK